MTLKYRTRRTFVLLLAVILMVSMIHVSDVQAGIKVAKPGKAGGAGKGKKGGSNKGKKGGSNKGNKGGKSAKKGKAKPDIVTQSASGIMESKTFESLFLVAKAAPAPTDKKGKSKGGNLLKIDFHEKTKVTLDDAPSHRGKVLPGMYLIVKYAIQKSSGLKVAVSIDAYTKRGKAPKAKPAGKKPDNKKPEPKKKPAPKKKK